MQLYCFYIVLNEENLVQVSAGYYNSKLFKNMLQSLMWIFHETLLCYYREKWN